MRRVRYPAKQLYTHSLIACMCELFVPMWWLFYILQAPGPSLESECHIRTASDHSECIGGRRTLLRRVARICRTGTIRKCHEGIDSSSQTEKWYKSVVALRNVIKFRCEEMDFAEPTMLSVHRSRLYSNLQRQRRQCLQHQGPSGHHI